MTGYSLKVKGWKIVQEGMNIPSYCKSCRRQTIHVCTGIRQDGEAELIRLECKECMKKLGKKVPFFNLKKKKKTAMPYG